MLITAYAFPHLAASGDWGCNSNTDQTVKSIKNHGATLTLGLGDYSYEDNSVTCWLNKVAPIDEDNDPSTPARTLKINIGNHDDDSSSKLNALKNHFGLTNLYYSFNIENVHVLVINTEDSSSSLKETSGAQNKFIKSDLESASADPNIRWKIVIFHKPMFTSPNGCSSSSCEGSSSLTRAIEPYFDTYKVDAIFVGHVHNYQRSFPVKFNPSNPLNPTTTTKLPNDYVNPTGRIYAIVGTGGVNFHSLTGSKANFIATQQATKFGQLDITFSQTATRDILTGQFCANDKSVTDPCSISSNILDKFTIQKNFATTLNSNNANPNEREENAINSMSIGDDPFSNMGSR
jgi:hypothetical protein